MRAHLEIARMTHDEQELRRERVVGRLAAKLARAAVGASIEPQYMSADLVRRWRCGSSSLITGSVLELKQLVAHTLNYSHLIAASSLAAAMRMSH